MKKTIAAICTPIGTGGVSIIRISGADAIHIADKIYKGASKLSDVKTHTINYGYIVDEQGIKIDEVLVSVMKAPKSFTCEDIIEINTHGGIVVTNKVLDLVIKSGAYPAQPGEFTKRAFLNGRIDLSQAEAVIDIINAKNDLSQKNAMAQLQGILSKKIHDIRQSLVDLCAHMQVAIDYPDEDLEDITPLEITKKLKECNKKIETLLSTADNGKIVRDGIDTAIVGKPNVGKSSLLNYLSGIERAIVTDIAGTTRDVIEEYVNLDGIPLKLIDTAGIRETDDIVEKIGVEKSNESIQRAQLVIVMIDANSPFDDQDKLILNKTENKNRIILINKSDLGYAKSINDIKSISGDSPIIEISAKTGDGISILCQTIKEMYSIGELSKSDGALITNMRHKASLINANNSLNQAINSMESGMPQDLASIDINIAIDSLGEITGATVSDDIVSSIFHSFCVGK